MHYFAKFVDGSYTDFDKECDYVCFPNENVFVFQCTKKNNKTLAIVPCSRIEYVWTIENEETDSTRNSETKRVTVSDPLENLWNNSFLEN